MQSKLGILLLLFMLLDSYCCSEFGAVLRAQGSNPNVLMLTPQSEGGCCFSLAYDYVENLGIDRLEVALWQTTANFSAVNYPLTSDWRLRTLQANQHLQWTYTQGDIPIGRQSLFDFCLENWNTLDSVSLLVSWFAGNTRRQTDTLRMGCNRCWQAEADSLVCNADQSYTYTFNFRNDSGFVVDFLSIYEPAGQNVIAAETIPLSTPLNPGGSTPPITLAIDPSVQALGELCFGLTPRQYRQDSIAIACCSASYCLPLPLCDTCCTAYAEYEADVNASFQIMGNCETRTLTIMANALSDCDRVNYTVTGLGGGLVEGNGTIQIGGLVDEVSYQVCMRVTRESLAGEACYPDGDLEICQDYFFDCDFCFEENNIDLENNCPVILDPVCGCDEMTYLNACTAQNWGGLNFWTDGCCATDTDTMQIDLVEMTTAQGFVQLDWIVRSSLPLRYFLVQRRLPGGFWFTINQLPPTELTYTDNEPLQPRGEYRILAVAESGKLLLSEAMPDCIEVSTSEPQVLEGGRIWPNPTRDWLEVELPLAQRAEVEVFNLLGQSLQRFTTDSQGHAQLSTATWPTGTYYLVMRPRTGLVWRKAFVRQP